MSYEDILMHKLELGNLNLFDLAWFFSKNFGFKLQPNLSEGLCITLFSLKPDCSIIETKLSGRETLISFFYNPLPHLLRVIKSHDLKVNNFTIAGGAAKHLHDLTVTDNFSVDYQDQNRGKYNLRGLLERGANYRVAWAYHVIEGCYDNDREFDLCFEMNDGQLVAKAIDYLFVEELEPTRANIGKALEMSSYVDLLGPTWGNWSAFPS